MLRRFIRVTALTTTVTLLLLAGPAHPLPAQPAAADEGPCQVFCDALFALCTYLGGGALCKDMRAGCHFGCNLRGIME